MEGYAGYVGTVTVELEQVVRVLGKAVEEADVAVAGGSEEVFIW